MPYPFDSSPAVQAIVVTPSNSAGFPECRSLFVGTGGDVAVVAKEGGVVTFKNVGNAQILPIRAVRVNSTNTTATDIVALY